MCGENPPSPQRRPRRRGSSPRVRGKLDAARGERAHDGLIPACAGKTRTPCQSHGLSRAHPRVCGENARPEVADRARAGSSPRVRGKPDPLRPPRHRRGLIPACAGKTAHPRGLRPGREAHPRVCGENGRRFDTSSPPPGSSPRVRGKRPVRHGGIHGGRLIPACAGKTGAASSR